MTAPPASDHPNPDQLPLTLDTNPPGTSAPSAPADAVLDASSSLEMTRAWFRSHLIATGMAENTVSSYTYDLIKLQQIVGNKPIRRIASQDLARYLADSTSSITRKRRLTTIKRLYAWLIEERKILKDDPTEPFSPHPLPTLRPLPLSTDEQDRLLAAAESDEAWSGTAIWLMMRLGLTRGELLALQRDDIDRTHGAGPLVHVRYDDRVHRFKDRRLPTSDEFRNIYDTFLTRRDPEATLFRIGPPAVNGMVDRVRRRAGIARDVTPQHLRQTCAVSNLLEGMNGEELLKYLGMADDPRNRQTIRAFVDYAEALEEHEQS